jgi:hypothetical protein
LIFLRVFDRFFRENMQVKNVGNLATKALRHKEKRYEITTNEHDLDTNFLDTDFTDLHR